MIDFELTFGIEGGLLYSNKPNEVIVLGGKYSKRLDFDDVYKRSDAVIVHSLYNTKAFVSAEILKETEKKNAGLKKYL